MQPRRQGERQPAQSLTISVRRLWAGDAAITLQLPVLLAILALPIVLLLVMTILPAIVAFAVASRTSEISFLSIITTTTTIIIIRLIASAFMTITAKGPSSSSNGSRRNRGYHDLNGSCLTLKHVVITFALQLPPPPFQCPFLIHSP